MKKKGTHCDFIPSRNDFLKREFFARLGSHGLTVNRIVEDISRAPAPRFFISEERAYRIIRAFYHRKHRRNVAPQIRTRKAMMADIQDRVAALMKTNPALPLSEVVFRVVNSPAPSCYLTPSSIRSILYRHLRS